MYEGIIRIAKNAARVVPSEDTETSGLVFHHCLELLREK